MAENKPRKIALLIALITSFLVVLAVVLTTFVSATSAPERIAPAGGEPVGAKTPEKACDYAGLIGKRADDIDKTSLGNHPFRILTPDMMVTMDYLEGRVNLHVDDHGLITSVTCG